MTPLDRTLLARLRKLDWRNWLLANLIRLVARLIASTLRLSVVNQEPAQERHRQRLPTINVTWHGRTLLPTWYYGRQHWVAIISLSRDGEMQARIFEGFGWQLVRGSSGRGGIRALVGAVKKLQEGNTLAFTPDGPKGPSHTVHPGVLFLAQKSGAPIYPVGISAYPRLLAPTWDRYLIPCPFGRAVMIYGEPLFIARSATPDELAEAARELTRRMCEIEEQAEAMVTPVGRRVPCQPGVPPTPAADSEPG